MKDLGLGRSQVVRHGNLDPAFEGSNPSAPAIYTGYTKSDLVSGLNFYFKV